MDTKTFVQKYIADFCDLPKHFENSGRGGNALSFDDAVNRALKLVLNAQTGNKKVMIIGNGGSAGIASHMAVDYWKNGGIKATAFNDTSLLTCISNDFSYQEVFSKPVEFFGEEGDVLMAISSSGNSPNIIKAAEVAGNKKCSVITFSGFSKENSLRKNGDINFYVPSLSYGYVELWHNYIIHCILDAKLYCYDKVDIFNKNLPL